MPINKNKLPAIQDSSEFDTTNPKVQQKSLQWIATSPCHTIDDLILDIATHTQLLDVISYFQNRDLLFSKWGLEERFGHQDSLAVNLYGPPGTGKTVAAHAIAAALNLPIICVDYAAIESKYVGETSKNLSNLFKTATEQQAAIFFDEADALLSKRVTNMSSATDVSVNQTRSVLLNLLNNYHGVILFATNFIQNFDAAFLRRIKYHIHFNLPNAALREKLWRMYIPSRMPCQIDYADIAAKFDNISGSDIANAVFTTAIRAARNNNSIIQQEQFEESIQYTLNVKHANAGENITVNKRMLSEEEVKEKLQIKERTT